MKPVYIMDTNVAKIADFDDSPQASPECQQACVQFVEDIIRYDKHRLLIDAKWLIMTEYRNVIKKKGGIGEQLIRWVSKHMGDENLCMMLNITPQNGTFTEYPDDTRLIGFDPSDKKWIALARAYMHHHPHHPAPPIAQAGDIIKWRDFESVFGEYGIIILWMCR